MLPVSVHELLTEVNPKKRHGMDVTSTGVIAVYSGPILALYYDTGKQFEPWHGAMPFNSDITTIAWCKSADPSGEIPFYLLVTSEDGGGYIINMTARTQICAFSLPSGHVTASAWCPSSNSKFYICTSNGDVSLYSYNYQKVEQLWTYKAGFAPDYIRVNPNNNDQIIVASVAGQFAVLTPNTPPKTPSTFSVEAQCVMDVQFFPFFDGVVIFVMNLTILIYIIEKDCFMPLLTTNNSQESIQSLFFPDMSNDNNMLIIFKSHCLLIKNVNLDFDHGKSQYVKYLSPLKQTKELMLSFATYKNKLYVHGYDNTLQLYEFKNNKVWATRISRSINSIPVDYDSKDNSIIFGCENGVVCITPPDNNSCSLTKFFKINNFSISKVYFVSKNSVIITGLLENHAKVFFVDYSKMCFQSLLKKSVEIVSEKPAKVIVSKNGHFICLILDEIHSLYEIVDNEAKHLRTLFLNQGDILCFTNNEKEIWYINQQNKGQKLKIDLNTPEVIYSARLSNFGEKWGKPQVCAIVNDLFLVGMHNGNVVLFDWDGNTPISLSLQEKAPVSATNSFDGNSCFFIDQNNTVCKVNLEQKRFGQYMTKATKILPLDEKVLLVQIPKRNSLTALSADTMKIVAPPISTVLDGFPLTISIDERKDSLVKILTNSEMKLNDWINAAYSLHFTLIGDLLSALNDSQFSVDAFGANMKRENLKGFLNSLYLALDNTKKEDVRMAKVRIALILDKVQDAFQLLVTESPESPTFTLSVLKSSFLHTENQPERLSMSIEALKKGEKFDDAVDLMMITRKYMDAAKQLIELNEINFAVIAAKLRLSDSDFLEFAELISDALMKKKMQKNAACILIACHKFKKAASVLSDGGYLFPAKIFNAMKEENNHIYFDSTKI
ncbi:hypothetical protein TRFO_34506 [Tritrichomonas foetus]|uniref:Uncharacterized protein n=1 Tax=Tritrichomonas foetus TaxID=1144522 RepID=A0A1J4JJ20_9EUKA|nr:hypothetical protein TRFO_34506 [Tritrichomonas foetus]|eukprot:OHS99146.1 hypothetical protein TRFO_34506 [Tritrichomonas foetus]